VPVTVKQLNDLIPANKLGDFADFEWDQAIGKFVGHLVLREFRGVAIPERQKWVWELLRHHFGEDSQQVSLVLAYSPEEWEEVAVESA
jgi:hypothetical protein